MKKIFLLAAVVCMASCSGKADTQSNVESATQVKVAEQTAEAEGMLPRTILGCTLGKTGLAQAKKILKAKGYPATECKDDGCVCLQFEKDFQFDGQKWQWAMLMFFDGSLIRVELMSRGSDIAYADKLNDKYGDNYCIRKEHNIYLNDDRTSFKYTTSEPGEDADWSTYQMTITDFERNDLLPKGKDRMELY